MVFGYILHTRKKHLIKSSHREKIEQNKQKKKKRKKPMEANKNRRKQNRPINNIFNILGKTIEDFASRKQG